MSKIRSSLEAYNDLDQRIYTVFKVLQDREKAKELEYRLRYTPYSRNEWEEASSEQYPEDDIEMARHTIVRAFMSKAANGATRTNKSGFGLMFSKGTDKISGVDGWPRYSDCIQTFTEPLQGVVIENKDAMKLIKFLDSPETLHYVDPPYVNITWNHKDKYKHSCDEAYHKELLALLKEVEGMVVLSGYDNELYKEELTDWPMFSQDTRNQLNEKRTECIWISPRTYEKRGQKSLLELK